ncbi:hypothetical protein ACFWUW_31080 [Streptomyces sp. NPDC058655]|uniref:hypothetical protein n=1 Tax=unclassified Streptomyces TaxID=2593676 RepID=UPI003660083D
MRMRSALTASVLAAGILLGGAGAALADDAGEGEFFSGSHAGFAATCSTAAAVPAHFGPVYTSSCAAEGEQEHWQFGHFTLGH